MHTSIRYFSREEAEALLPQLAPLLVSIQHGKGQVDAKLKDWEIAEKEGEPQDAAILRGQIEFMAKDIENQIDKVHAFGCLVKDLDTGLVDFPARMLGREAYLCWKLGEPAIGFWHGLSEGYAGRKPL